MSYVFYKVMQEQRYGIFDFSPEMKISEIVESCLQETLILSMKGCSNFKIDTWNVFSVKS